MVAGTAIGRVRAMMDYRGQRVKSAPPSMAVEIQGLSEVPEGGDLFYVVEDEKMAKKCGGKQKAKN